LLQIVAQGTNEYGVPDLVKMPEVAAAQLKLL
jgi:hypothetical protein